MASKNIVWFFTLTRKHVATGTPRFYLRSINVTGRAQSNFYLYWGGSQDASLPLTFFRWAP